MTQKISSKLLTLVFSVLVLCFLATLYIFAWTEPGSTPPLGNVDKPLNVGLTPQTKTGALTFPIFYDSDGTTYYVNPKGSGTPLISATLLGRVGIGTAAPEQKLHVYTSGADNHILSDVASGDIYDSLFTMRVVGEIVWNIGIDTSDSNKFKIASGGSWNNLPAGTKLTIDSSGNVGIGTTTPIAKLHVSGGDLIVGSGMTSGVISIQYLSDVRGSITSMDSEGPTDLWLQTSGVLLGGSVFSVPTYKLEIATSQLGGTAGDTVNWEKISGNSGEGNMNQLRIFHNRYTTPVPPVPTDWSSAEIKIQKTVGTTDMHYISFKGLSDYTSALTFGYGTTGQMALLQNGNFGIGRGPTANRLEVEGNASKTTAGSWLANSDIRIKTDIQDIGNALDVIGMLRPVKFRYSEEYMAQHPSITDQYYYNFIAQDFQRVFPGFVQDDGEGYLQIDTYPVTPYLVSAVQELNKTVEELKTENNALQKRIEILESK